MLFKLVFWWYLGGYYIFRLLEKIFILFYLFNISILYCEVKFLYLLIIWMNEGKYFWVVDYFNEERDVLNVIVKILYKDW